MEPYKIERDILLFYVQAESFPLGVGGAFKKLNELIGQDWRKDETIIGRTFQELLRDPHIDKEGYCLEMYYNENDMRCLVPLWRSRQENL